MLFCPCGVAEILHIEQFLIYMLQTQVARAIFKIVLGICPNVTQTNSKQGWPLGHRPLPLSPVPSGPESALWAF